MDSIAIRLKNSRMTFAEKLRKLHTGRGWNQADVARAVGVSEGAVSNWLKGKGRPDLEIGLNLARAFGVPLEFLADDGMEGPPPSIGGLWEDVLKVAATLGPEASFARLIAMDAAGKAPAGPAPDRELVLRLWEQLGRLVRVYQLGDRDGKEAKEGRGNSAV